MRALLLLVAVALRAQTPEPGTLPATWLTSNPNCPEIPAWQVHQYNDSFYILRQSGCTNYEKPFLYLIFGKERTLLVDTGAEPSDAAGFVGKLRKGMPLVVAHSHGHGDHVAGDQGFAGMPGVTLVQAKVEDCQKAFGMVKWPESAGSIDLGDRVVDVLAIPGHQTAHLAFYDRRTGILLTGDHLYPGRLYVNVPDFAAYAASTRRLVEFTEGKPVAHILGCHIEQSSTPFVDYPTGTVYQPHEHSLEMGRGQLLELLDAVERMKGDPRKAAYRDFTVVPRVPRVPRAR